MKKLFTITELSTLTNKTRPTLYKYVSAYESLNYNEIPYNFILLFDLINKDNVSKNEVINFCKSNFTKVDDDSRVNKIIDLILENKEKLDLEKLEDFILKETTNGKGIK